MYSSGIIYKTDEKENRDYRRFREIIREEIRLGVIPG